MDYNKLLEKARKVYAESVTGAEKRRLESIFPELEESEDERIRKEILEYIDKATGCKEWVAWLEKQGEKSTIIDIDKMVKEYSQTKDGDFGLPVNCMIRAYRQGINDTLRLSLNLEKQGGNTNETINRDKFAQGVLKGAAINLITWIDYNAAEGNMCLSNMECEDIEDSLVNGNWDKIYAYIKKKLEKQGEQKPANKTEPWFKVGDWVVYETNEWREVLQIKTIESGRYTFTNGSSSSSTEEQNMRFWTIQDAKDGDILVYDDITMIFKNIKTVCAANTYILYCVGEGIVVDDWCDFGNNAQPATKEQCDLLFRKMREAGYEWDADKKELKKIEQELYPETLDKAIELYYYSYGNDKGGFDNLSLEKFKDIVKTFVDDYGMQKPAWSEEDEQYCRYIIDFYLQKSYGATAMAIEWLENLKNRVQPHWKPTEEQMSMLLAVLNDSNNITAESVCIALKSLYNDLKKL